MNNKNKRGFQAIVQNSPEDILWKDIVSLFIDLKCKVIEGNGSRIKFIFGSRVLALHKPHNPKTVRKYQRKIIKEFLESL